MTNVEPSDAELNQHIKDAGDLMLAAEARYLEGGCFSDIGDRDRWAGVLKDAVLTRAARQTDATIAEWEAMRGLV